MTTTHISELPNCPICSHKVCIQEFGPSEHIPEMFETWVCSNNFQLGGTCRSSFYLSEDYWKEHVKNYNSEEKPNQVSNDYVSNGSTDIPNLIKLKDFFKQTLKSLNICDTVASEKEKEFAELLSSISPDSGDDVLSTIHLTRFSNLNISLADDRYINISGMGSITIGEAGVGLDAPSESFVGYYIKDIYKRRFALNCDRSSEITLDLWKRNSCKTVVFKYDESLLLKEDDGVVTTVGDVSKFSPSLQERKDKWMRVCFSDEITDSPEERNRRFIEEALELVQSLNMSRHEAHFMVDYVFDRAKGEPFQEVGGTLLTLAALCNVHKIDMMEAGETELSRVWRKVPAIREKQSKKPNLIDDIEIVLSYLNEQETNDLLNMDAIDAFSYIPSEIDARYNNDLSRINLINAVQNIPIVK